MLCVSVLILVFVGLTACASGLYLLCFFCISLWFSLDWPQPVLFLFSCLVFGLWIEQHFHYYVFTCVLRFGSLSF